jgi:hypothetical protein
MPFLFRILQLEKGADFFEFGSGFTGGQETAVPDFEEA